MHYFDLLSHLVAFLTNFPEIFISFVNLVNSISYLNFKKNYLLVWKLLKNILQY